ncbi:MBL fold metallo-hydrolase [Exilibacterium tricleocarpae]|uniref:MBL fold metallo-hydrolase n=2 Tax=Exilibacterium tricleocarpae TaxID=2591008 RepID=A0A545UA35_9GAMM|nr:MBL fold metallo-hydrolase [Exilibacterium tricleocarpae]
MTGPGTNTYLVGREQVAVIDPGPALDSHLDVILAAAGERLRWVLVTHTHPDHSPGARRLREATGAELIGAVMADDGHQDQSFVPDQPLVEDWVLHARDFTLQAVATPGHVGNHFCFYLPQEHTLFTGDHIMQGATVVIVPPSGDMAAYIASLEKLKHLPLQRLAPAHGHLMGEAARVVDELVRHRLSREDKVIKALAQSGQASLDQLLETVYDDVDPRLLRVAKVSLWAHLLKLEKEARASKHAEAHWLFGEELWELIEHRS